MDTILVLSPATRHPMGMVIAETNVDARSENTCCRDSMGWVGPMTKPRSDIPSLLMNGLTRHSFLANAIDEEHGFTH